MVDLSRTEGQMLTEIGINGDHRRARAPWRLAGRTPTDLLPMLTTRFSTCYAHLPIEHVSDNLIDLVKKGLGNAYKWGNERDHNKLLMITTVMTRTGAVIRITDQGSGFDVPRVVTDRTFTHGGSGLCRFHRSSSVVSYADGGRTLLIRFLSDTGPDSRVDRTRIATVTPPNTSSIELNHLKPRDQVKVKCVLQPNGDLLATKVTLKPFEELAVIEAPLQHVHGGGRAIRILGLIVVLSERIDITGADSRPAGFNQLKSGQVVELTGKYVPGKGLRPVRIKIRRTANPQVCELQGRIDEIDHRTKRFRVLGIAAISDDHTEVRASPQVLHPTTTARRKRA